MPKGTPEIHPQPQPLRLRLRAAWQTRMHIDVSLSPRD